MATKEFLTAQHWMEFMILNVDGRMSDSQFREFVRHNLPTVIGHELARKGLIERGRIKEEPEPETMDVGTEIRLAPFRGNFQDRDMEPFSKK